MKGFLMAHLSNTLPFLIKLLACIMELSIYSVRSILTGFCKAARIVL